jgi:hypothetical protein
MENTFNLLKKISTMYGVMSGIVLGTVAVLAALGDSVTSFMWGRSAGVLASALVTYWLVDRASKGARWAYVRVRIITVVVPVAIVAVDLIPGLCPMWFLVMQAMSAIALGAAAFVVNASPVRAAFAKA